MNKCGNCGFIWNADKDHHGEHDCLQVKDAAYHYVCIERDKLRVENTVLREENAQLCGYDSYAEQQALREEVIMRKAECRDDRRTIQELDARLQEQNNAS